MFLIVTLRYYVPALRGKPDSSALRTVIHGVRVLTMKSLSELKLLSLILAITITGASLNASAATHHPLQIYFIDVEGGQSTLFVTPSQHSLLIDTGWPGNEGRDAGRIAAAAKAAGIARIDYVLLTH